jgi:hypothetical protein
MYASPRRLSVTATVVGKLWVLSALVGLGFTSDMALLKLSILSRASMPDREKSKDDKMRAPYVPAASLMDDPTVVGLDDLWLMHYESSPKQGWWFCGRCGTQIAITASKDTIPPDWGWPRVVNLWGGTVQWIATCSRMTGAGLTISWIA